MRERLEETVNDSLLQIGIGTGDFLVVGCSGGPDSMVLLHVLVRLGFKPTVAHVNYGLRGHASERDQALVESAAGRLRLSVHLSRPAHEKVFYPGESIQKAARVYRYSFMERVARELGLKWVAVGHHRDDQAETVILSLLRGTGLEAIAGMRRSRPVSFGSSVSLVRPMLALRRQEVLDYADRHGIQFGLDTSNTDPRFLRSIVRSVILPGLVDRFGEGIVDRIERLASVTAKYVDGGFRKHIDEVFAAAAGSTPDGTQTLDVDLIMQLGLHTRGRVLLEAVRRWAPTVGASRANIGQIDKLMLGQTGRRVKFKGLSVWRDRSRLIFDTEEEVETSEVPVTLGHPVDLGGATLVVEEVAIPRTLGAEENVEYLDRDCLPAPLTARLWNAGDRFRPLGMKSSKRLSEYLTDQRAPAHRKARTWVLTAGGDIVLVVGYGISDRVRLRPDSKRAVRVRIATRSEWAGAS